MNDPVYTIRVNHEQKQQILEDWTPVAISFIKASHPLIRAGSNMTYAWIRKWMLKYVPHKLFETFMLPKRLCSVIGAAGHPRIHSTGGYFFVGLEIPESEREIVPWLEKEEID